MADLQSNVRLGEKWALITGGSRGLGFEVARGLARAGFSLFLVAQDPERLRQAANNLEEEFPSLTLAVKAVDLADERACSKMVAEVSQEREKLDLLILAHGVMSDKNSRTLRTDYREWRRVLATNLDSVFTLLNGFVPAMVESREGRAVVFSACLGRMSGPGNTGGLAPYRVSKAGVNALVRNLSFETGLGKRGFLIDAICPGHCQTDMGGAQAPRSAEKGAQSALWLALRDFDPAQDKTGLLWEDFQSVEW